MGYDLHITRQQNWWKKDPFLQIMADEWDAVVESEEDMQRRDAVEVASPLGDIIRYEGPCLVQWTKHPEGKSVWFDLRSGNIIVTRPDAPTIARMKQLAGRLGAHLQGDEGEFYN